MARFYCLMLLLAIAYRAYSLSEYEEAEMNHRDNLDIFSRTEDMFEVSRYVPALQNKTIRDCDRSLRNQYRVHFAALRADNGREYYAHIVTTEYAACFVNRVSNATLKNIKECLDYAAARPNSVNSFRFDKATGNCEVYSNWREHKFRQCKRGSGEKMYYLFRDRPNPHTPCDGVVMAFTVTYARTGTVTVTARFNNAPCICDVDRITYRFLGTEYQMTIPDYTYTYLTSQMGNWLNTTEVRAYADGQMVAENLNFIPGNLL